MAREVRVTTSDNPFNPFTQFDQWLSYDREKGYNTCEQLASLVISSDSLTDEEQNDIIEDAISILQKTGAFSNDGKHVEFVRVYNDEN